MGDIRDTVFLGKFDEYSRKIEKLAELAQPESWASGKDRGEDPYHILRNYFQYTYNRLEEEGKIITSKCGSYRCMNTGLLTKYNQDILAIFSLSRAEGEGMLPWYFNGFFKDSDRFFTSNFSIVPEIANYFDNPADLIYDRNLKIHIQKEHIIDNNFYRFVDIGYDNKEVILALLDSARSVLVKKLERNFRLASPSYYSNTETGEKKIQLLAPVYLPGSPVRLAFVLDKVVTDAQSYYEAVTVIPIEWAYMNSRLIAKPDGEWVKIIEESESEAEDHPLFVSGQGNASVVGRVTQFHDARKAVASE